MPKAPRSNQGSEQVKNEAGLTEEQSSACLIIARSIYGHIVSLLGNNLQVAFAITMGVSFALAAKAGISKEFVQKHVDAGMEKYEPVKETLQ